MTTILNFSHPLTDAQLSEVFEKIPEVIEIPVQITSIERTPLVDQIAMTVDAVGFTPDQWQVEDFIVNLPGLAAAAAGILAEIHGRSGHFPRVLVLERVDGKFQIAGIEDLQSVRESARACRF